MKRKWIKKAMALLTAACMTASIAGVTTAHAEEALTGKDCELSVMVTWSDETDAVARTGLQQLEKLQEKYPDLKLNVEVVANDLYQDKVKTLIATDSLPDIFQALPGLMTNAYDNDQIMDLAPILAEDTEWSDRMLEGAFNDFTFGDTILGVPQSSIVCSMIVYNKAIFEECGITEFPKTVEDFEKAVVAIKEKGYIPVACGNKVGYMIASQIMPSVLFRYVDTDWYESFKNQTGAKYTDENAVAAITEMKNLADMGMYNEDVNSQEELLANAYYYNGQAAMLWGGYWITKNVVVNATEDVLANSAVATFPGTAENPDYASYIPGGQGWGLSLNSSLEGDEKAIALDFVKSLSEPEVQSEIIEGGCLPIAESAEYDLSGEHPLITEMLDMIDAQVMVPTPETQLNASYVAATYDGYQELLIGTLTPEQLAEKLQTAFEEGEE